MSQSGSGGSGSTPPKYGSVKEVPVSGVGRWNDPKKRDALQQANKRLQLDLVGETVVTNDDSFLDLAANTYATYVLARGIVDPVSQKGGDLADDGSRRAEFAQQFLDDYNSIIADITGQPDGQGPGDGTGPGQDGQPQEDFYFNVM